MRHAATFPVVVLAVVLASAACDSFESPAGSAPGDASADRVPQQTIVTSDDEYARVARAEVPGFAGFYLENDGTPVIQLKDPTQRGAAERYLARHLAEARRGGRRGNASARPVFRTATYDFAELKGWSNQVHGLLSRGDVYTIDVDEVGNRVRVGVRDAAAVNAVRSEGAKMGIPAAALYVETQPAPEHRATVQDYHSTLIGGIQIAGAAGTCTQGFNAVRNGYWIFVTNSHCTNSYFASDGGWIYQPWYAGGYEVGWEVADRGVYKCNGLWAPSCRKADAAYIRVGTGYRALAQGVVARTAWAQGGPAPLTIIGQYDITWRYYQGTPPVGTYLDKTGRTSGSTFGQVIQSCVTIGQLVCQDVSNVWSQPGDSGSPMMYWIEGSEAQLYGILWGGPSGDWNTTYSSPLAGIEADLGPLSQLCLPGYGC